MLSCTLMLLVAATTATAAEVDEAIKEARAALKKGDAAAAMKAANKAMELDPKSAPAVFYRGEAYAAQRKHAEAIKDYDAALALDKTFLVAVNQRGGEKFKLGKIEESIEDFNTFLKAYPKEEAGHWRRGISFYYVGKYAEGAKQFYDGRVVFGADVENAFFHYLCNARKDGVEKARKALLALDGPDSRIPMMRIYDMLQGKAKPTEVIETAEKAKLEGEDATEAKFYGHLYVALFYEADGKADLCKEHLTAAVEKYKIGHYMWDVANVHLARLKKK
jgi:lipoprotein NlpI